MHEQASKTDLFALMFNAGGFFFPLLVKLNQKQSKYAPVNYNKLISNKRGTKIWGKVNGNGRRREMGAGLV